MPSVTDVQQQQQTPSNTHGKSTPPPPSSMQQISTDPNNMDSLTQAILLLDKKQRNLGKRKDKLESYQEKVKSGVELNSDQQDALAKFPEVIGQIECVKELSEQFKKLQAELAKNQKRLTKQIADEKRQYVSQRLREYAQIRYLLDHRPTSLKTEESTLLDELSAVIIPIDSSSNSISRSVDTVLSIYQSSSTTTTIKNLPGKNSQEVRDVLEQLLRHFQPQISSSGIPPAQEQIKESNETNNNNNDFNQYSSQSDTRTEHVAEEQEIQSNMFLSDDLNTQIQDNNDEQSPDPQQHLQTFTVVNSNQQHSLPAFENQQQDNSTNLVNSNDQQQQHEGDEQWQHQRGNGNVQRGGEQFYNEGGNRPYHRGRPHYYNQQWRGSYDARYDNSYGAGGGHRPYYENSRGRGGSNPNYRGNRGGNYRFGNRGYNNNGNGYQQPAQYQQNSNQQVRSAPPPPPSTQQQ